MDGLGVPDRKSLHPLNLWEAASWPPSLGFPCPQVRSPCHHCARLVEVFSDCAGLLSRAGSEGARVCVSFPQASFYRQYYHSRSWR